MAKEIGDDPHSPKTAFSRPKVRSTSPVGQPQTERGSAAHLDAEAIALITRLFPVFPRAPTWLSLSKLGSQEIPHHPPPPLSA